MSSLRILTDDAAASATITASTTAGALAATNVITNEPSEVWRATSTTAFLTLTFPAARSIDSVVLGWTNIAPGAVVTVELFAADADTVPVAQATPPIHAPLQDMPINVVAWFAQETPCRKLRITVSGNAANVQIGRVMAGARALHGWPATAQTSIAFVDKSSAARTESGSVRVEASKVHRVATIPIFASLPSESSALLALAATGKTRVAFVSLFSAPDDPRQQTHAFLGVLSSDVAQSLLSDSASESALTFEEVG